jgi:xanthine dehydrogenase accessory factor
MECRLLKGRRPGLNEIERIYRTLLTWKDEGKRMALATVVSIQGSAYRRPGARMLISEQGECTGMIGGGCFDADVREIGFGVMRTGTPELHLYRMAGADPWGLGMGCTGSVYVIVESLEEPSGIKWIKEVGSSIEEGGALLITHHFSKPIDYQTADSNGAVQIERQYGRLSADSRGREVPQADADPYAFSEKIEPAPRLVVFGAGNDAIPVVEYAHNSGFRVMVIDQREDLLNHRRFPKATGFIQAWPDDYKQKILALPGDHVVLMSHRLENDAEAFRLYSGNKPSYIGFLGPKSRTERILHEIVHIDPIALQALRSMIHAPIGLDLGAETAEEVAMSIVAELLAVKNQRSPKFLRDKQGEIHDDRPKLPSAMEDVLAAVAAGPTRSCGI